MRIKQLFQLKPEEIISQMMGANRETLLYKLLPHFFLELMKTYAAVPPRPQQSGSYGGPMEIGKYRTIEQAKQLLNNKQLSLPSLSVDPKK